MSFICKKCGDCCKNGIIVLYPEDIEAISKFLKMEQKEFIEMYCKETIITINTTKNFCVYYLDNVNSCVFLTDDNLCSINNVKPLQCKLGPESDFTRFFFCK